MGQKVCDIAVIEESGNLVIDWPIASQLADRPINDPIAQSIARLPAYSITR